VDPIELEGRCYLVCARGNSNWVRNARAAGEVTLVRALRRRRYAVRELSPDTLLPDTEWVDGGSICRSRPALSGLRTATTGRVTTTTPGVSK
jgi:hypothetical protein